MNEENKKINNQEVKDRKINILEDGSLEITELIEVKYTQKYRDYLTDFNQVKKWIEDINHTFTNDFKESRKQDLKKAEKTKKEMEEYVKKAEERFIEYNKQKKIKEQADYIKNLLNNRDIRDTKNDHYLSDVYKNLSKEVESYFTKEELRKLRISHERYKQESQNKNGN